VAVAVAVAAFVVRVLVEEEREGGWGREDRAEEDRVEREEAATRRTRIEMASCTYPA
jgi:hypothetical protein